MGGHLRTHGAGGMDLDVDSAWGWVDSAPACQSNIDWRQAFSKNGIILFLLISYIINIIYQCKLYNCNLTKYKEK